MTNKKDEENWWNALAGKSDANTPKGTIQTTELIRDSINQYEKTLLTKDYNVVKELSRLEQTLENEGLTAQSDISSQSLRKKWSQFLAVFATAFAFGALLMRFAMMPSMELARSGSEVITIEGIAAQKVPFYVETPDEVIGQITQELLTIDMKFAIQKENDRSILVIYDLIPFSPEQENLKKVLGINVSASGTVVFEILKK